PGRDGPGLDRRLAQVQPEVRLAMARVLAMAGETVLGEDGPDVAVEVDLSRGRRRRGFDAPGQDHRSHGRGEGGEPAEAGPNGGNDVGPDHWGYLLYSAGGISRKEGDRHTSAARDAA